MGGGSAKSTSKQACSYVFIQENTSKHMVSCWGTGKGRGGGGGGRGFPLLRVSPSVVDIFLILGDLFVPALLGAQKQPQRNALLLLYLWEQPGFPK